VFLPKYSTLENDKYGLSIISICIFTLAQYSVSAAKIMEQVHKNCTSSAIIPGSRNAVLVKIRTATQLHTTTLHLFNSLFSRTTRISRYQKGKPFRILMKQGTMGWQWHQLDHMQIICIILQTINNHASISTLSFYGPNALPAAQPTVSKH